MDELKKLFLFKLKNIQANDIVYMEL